VDKSPAVGNVGNVCKSHNVTRFNIAKADAASLVISLYGTVFEYSLRFWKPPVWLHHFYPSIRSGAGPKVPVLLEGL
jgi:hypothetical protein